VKPQAQLSFVIPVYNGSPTIGTVVELILDVYRDLDIEIVLVNDGSHDDSERVCRELRRAHPETLTTSTWPATSESTTRCWPV
jgi:glycosyltransferase involved in cell wall biosynthesis